MEPNLEEMQGAQMQGPPVSPSEVGGIQEGGLSQDEMKSNLVDMMSKIEGKYQNFNAQKFSSANQSEESQGNALRKIFDMFNKMGVDPSDPEQVREFLDKLKESNPEVSKQLEGLLEKLLGEEIPDSSEDALGAEIPVTEDPLVGQPPVGGMESGKNINMNMQNNVPPQENI